MLLFLNIIRRFHRFPFLSPLNSFLSQFSALNFRLSSLRLLWEDPQSLRRKKDEIEKLIVLGIFQRSTCPFLLSPHKTEQAKTRFLFLLLLKFTSFTLLFI